MKTAEEIILEIKELSPEECQKIADYLFSNSEVKCLEEDYSPEDIVKILKTGEEAKQGINVDRFSSMDEAIRSLGLTQASNDD